MLKKVIVFCAVILTAAVFISCGETETAQNNNDGQQNITQETAVNDEPGEQIDMSVTPELPDIQFDGYAFNFINTENDSVTWLLTMLEAEEETGDIFPDAVYRRNRTIEERYNIVLNETLVADLGQVNSRARTVIAAGGEEYDLYMLNAGDALGRAQDGSLIDYKSIPYVDLDKRYWDQDMVRDFSLANRLFVMSGDFNFTNYSATTVMFFNKQMHSNLQLDDPYKLVHDGKWTFEKFHEMAKTSSRDLDGNGIFNQHDQYGYMSLNFLLYPAFIIAGDEKFLVKDPDDDTPFLNVGTERFSNVYHKILDIMHDGDLLYDADLPGRDHRHQDVMFPGNQALFWTELMNWAKILRDMEADFGILPHPKYNETQEGYHSVVFGASYMAVPSTTRDLMRTGIILEALCAESRKSVMPVYYESVLKTKTARDDESGAMLDIIFSGRNYEQGHLFFGSTVFDPFNTMARANNGDLSAYVERNESRIVTAIDRVLDKFYELE